MTEIERKREDLSYREFAYDAVHVVLDLSGSPGTEAFPGHVARVCEVQVRTYLQEAWAEVEHELVYKSGVVGTDNRLRMKLAALNASLTLGDTVFQEIRDHQKHKAKWGRKHFQELRSRALGLNESAREQILEAEVVSGPDANTLASVTEQALRANEAGNYNSAISNLEIALELSSHPKTRARLHNAKGLSLFLLGAQRDALDEFTLALELEPDHIEALNNRALAWRQLGVISQSTQDFDQSLALNPMQAEVHFFRAQTFLSSGDAPERAHAELARALELDPEYERARELMRQLV